MLGSPSGQDFSRIFVGNYNFLKFREAINALFIPGFLQPFQNLDFFILNK